MIITKKQFKHKFEVVIEDNKIKQKSFVKDLGILIDDKLNWKHQVKQICLKIARGSWALYYIRNYQRWSPRGRPWPRGRPQGHILKSLASKVKFLALASWPQVLENWPVLGSRTALFF